MGSSSVTNEQTILFADNMSFDGTHRGGAMTTDGELWIGHTTSDRPNNSGHVKKGTLICPDGTIAIGYSSPNITLRATVSGIPPIGSSTNNGIVTWNGTSGNALNSTPTTVSNTGIINGPDGTATAPTYSFTSHTTSGMYVASTGLYFTFLGIERAHIDSSGIWNCDSGLWVGGQSYFNSGVGYHIVNQAVSYNASVGDYYICITDTTASRVVTLPNTGLKNGQTFYVKDRSGAASNGNLSVTVSGGVITIDGATTYTFSTNYQAVGFVWNTTNFSVI